MTKCLSRHPQTGAQCVRDAGHRGAHAEAGVDLGLAVTGRGRARRFRLWVAEMPTPLALHDCVTRHVRNDAFRKRRLAANKKAKRRVAVHETSLQALGATLDAEARTRLQAVRRQKRR